MPISWGGFGANVGIYSIHGVSGICLLSLGDWCLEHD